MKALIAVVAVVVILGIIGYAATRTTSMPAETTVNTNTTYMTDITPTGSDMDMALTTSPLPSQPVNTMNNNMTPAVSMSPAASSQTMFVKLGEQSQSGQSGTADITEANGKVTVKILLSGTTANSDEPAHIHLGSCPTPGDVKYSLNNVKNGQSTTTLNTTLAQLKAQMPLAINIHKSSSEMSTYTACGDLMF